MCKFFYPTVLGLYLVLGYIVIHIFFSILHIKIFFLPHKLDHAVSLLALGLIKSITECVNSELILDLHGGPDFVVNTSVFQRLILKELILNNSHNGESKTIILAKLFRSRVII